MKFQVTMHKNAIEKINNPIKLSINLCEKQDNRIPLYFCYFENQKEIRIIVLLSKTPIILVLNQKMMKKVIAKSNSGEQGNFQIIIKVQNGLAFLQSVLSFIDSQDQQLTIKLEKKDEQRVIILQGSKQERCLRIDKPIKAGSPQSQELYSHRWFNGIRDPALSFSFHTQDLINFLHMATKSKKYQDFFTNGENPWIQFKIKYTQFSETDTNYQENYIHVYADDPQVPHYIKTYIKLLGPSDESLPKQLDFLIVKDNLRPLHEIFENGQCTLIINKHNQIALTSNNEDAYSCLVSIGGYIQRRKKQIIQTKMEQ